MAKEFVAQVLASSEVAGRGTVAVVAVRAGKVRVRDMVEVSGKPAEVTAVEPFAQDEEDRAEGLPQQVGLLLSGVDVSDVPKGSEVRAVRDAG